MIELLDQCPMFKRRVMHSGSGPSMRFTMFTDSVSERSPPFALARRSNDLPSSVLRHFKIHLLLEDLVISIFSTLCADLRLVNGYCEDMPSSSSDRCKCRLVKAVKHLLSIHV